MDEWVSQDRFVSPAQLDRLKEEGKFPASLSLPAEELSGEAPRRRRLERNSRNSLPIDPAYEQLEREHEEATKVKNIQRIIFGRYAIDCWYFSPYPDEYAQGVDLMYICEKCLKYMKSEATYQYHYHHCQYNGPPGKLVYLKESLAVFELEGEESKLYCQNLCLLSKLFLDHKTLYYDVSPFYFYVLCEVDDDGVHPVGYYSKEKASPDDYNLACIMILPPFQKRGYGRFLIQLSYQITKREGKTGTPEKPLSDLGKLSYSSFWTYELLTLLKSATRTIPSIKEISAKTGFKESDIVDTLTELGLMRQYRGQKVLNMAPRVIDALLKPFENKQFTLLDPECLKWP